TIALCGAALLLLLDNLGRPVEDQVLHINETFAQVEWITIFFFVGLFAVVAGVEQAGLLDWFAQQIVRVTGGSLGATALVVLWASGVLSGLLDNIPFVATMFPGVKNMAPTFGGPAAILPL